MSAPMKFDQWSREYKSVLRRGLSEGPPRYVRMLRKEINGLTVELAVCPMAMTGGPDGLVLFVNKVSVFPVLESSVSKPMSPAVLESWLLSAFPKIDFLKRSAERVGTITVLAINNPTMADCAEAALAFIVGMELQGEFESENPDLVLGAIKDAYVSMVFPVGKAPATSAEVIPFPGKPVAG